ncbi:SanA/YdcF family protein [Yinghuangia seranimata]|uniref:SanA/YdcF family protein n=1 Tax=Yinghuangia seranimata TaxID=408067 RepID=UPI00248C17C4|nr:ElyC/SanA/YdcF family protein [Yinghuangia seranimata]MDI2129719.1 ElyC/SanA/YdcF family protein [Yinghuangia seranimata]
MGSRVGRFVRTRRGQRVVFQLTAVLTVLGLTPVTWVYLVGSGRMRGVDDVPAAPVALVLGAGIDGDHPSRLLARRLDVSLALYRAGKVKVLLVSGDNGREGYNEPDVMRRYLVARGVPEAQVVSDYAGFSTWDSCVRAKKVFGVDRAIIVSQTFHLRRALALCDAAGLDAYGVGDDSLSGDTVGVTLFGGAREILAAYKALGEAVLTPDPKFLGPKEPGVERGLAAAG